MLNPKSKPIMESHGPRTVVAHRYRAQALYIRVITDVVPEIQNGWRAQGKTKTACEKLELSYQGGTKPRVRSLTPGKTEVHTETKQ